MIEFSRFDARHYPTLSVRDGYAEWVHSYEQTVADEMDLALLDSVREVAWAQLDRAADLGCGTGRTGAWLRAHGVRHIDGIDATPAMLAIARDRTIYDRLDEADVAQSGLATGAYDLVTTCLVDEHLRELGPLYREAARLLRPRGVHVVVGYHPHFIMCAGIAAHFDRRPGEPVAIETYVHLTSDHVAAPRAAELRLLEMHERLIDDRWIALKPKWERYRDHPISFAMVLQRD